MKFVVEATGLTVAGGKELALDLMASLAAQTEHQFIFIVPDLNSYRRLAGSNIRKIIWKRSSNLVWRARLLNYEVPKICQEERADALLCLGNFPPRKPTCPTVVLLQNAWIVYNDRVAESRRTCRENLIMAYGRRTYGHLPTQTSIITQTQVMKDRLCGRFGVDPRRVAIIPNALSLADPGGIRRYAPPNGNRRAEPFTFLCLARYYVHKNIDVLADATRILSKYTDRPAKCVITIAPEHHIGARRLLARLVRGDLGEKIVSFR